MIIDYKQDYVFTESIDVEDIGNTCIKAIAKDGVEYYAITKTILGKTSILKFGPVMPDLPLLCIGFSASFSKINYKENKICKEISMFLNNPKAEIEKAEVITEYEAYQVFPNVVEAFSLIED